MQIIQKKMAWIGLLAENVCASWRINSKVGYLEGTTQTKTNPAPETDDEYYSDDFKVIFSASNLNPSTDWGPGPQEAPKQLKPRARLWKSGAAKASASMVGPPPAVR